MSFLQYLKDVRGELRHVSWPTQTQTIIYTVLVVILSLLTAAYLGFFDYVFTTGLSRIVEVLPERTPDSFFTSDLAPDALIVPGEEAVTDVSSEDSADE